MTHSELIDKAGGTTAVARLCKVTEGAVSQWRNDGIPKARLMFLELALPEIFGSKSAKPAKAAA